MHPQHMRVLQQVHEMFRDTLDDAAIAATVEQNGYDAELAVDALFSLCSRSADSPKSEPAPTQQTAQEPEAQSGKGFCAL